MSYFDLNLLAGLPHKKFFEASFVFLKVEWSSLTTTMNVKWPRFLCKG